ncbi:lactonase family protein [Microterricola viridarii]|uniref:6-phosphogluconolactonase, cycloisomerase 2 family n=1 Tax=Microterricola viridarii TaxID=412690 RepID=A0A0Y0Q253_9MICO|nr:beta-propeller fold lactonase family protein [Microterricola viridarii]AMB60163.1 hypothetical protein AWU67_16300 [Microterricola viridarii]
MNATLLVGGYTGGAGAGTGIEAVRTHDGAALTALGTSALVDSPSYLARHPQLDVVYAACEMTRQVRAFTVHDGGQRLEPLGELGAAGEYVCHVTVDPGGRWLVASSYGDGLVHLFTLDASGAIVSGFDGPAAVDAAAIAAGATPRPSRAHAALALPDGRVATTDLGHDLLRVWSVVSGATGFTLVLDQELALPAGSGPRLLELHPNGCIYVVTEYSVQLLVIAPAGADGTYALTGIFPVLAGGEAIADGDTGAHISIDAAAARVYVTVRQRNSLHTFGIAEDGRTLHPLAEISTGGNWPRHHLQHGGQIHVANQLSDTVTTFALDADGIPSTLLGELATGAPTCLLAL